MNKIKNPQTGRMVKVTSALGKKLLHLQQHHGHTTCRLKNPITGKFVHASTSKLIKNPKTGRMVKACGSVGKQVIKNSGKKITNLVRRYQLIDPDPKVRKAILAHRKLLRRPKSPTQNNYNNYYSKATNAGFSIRFAQSALNYFNYIPTLNELRNLVNTDFGANFINHFGYI